MFAHESLNPDKNKDMPITGVKSLFRVRRQFFSPIIY